MAVSSVLLVKMSSLGDIIHSFAAVHDFKMRFPNVQLTWAAEEAYVSLLAEHPDVDVVLPVPLRRLRKTSHLWFLTREWRMFRKHFSALPFDLAIDAQGLLKSAVLTYKASAPQKVGFDYKSAREAPATAFYNRTIAVDKTLHAVTRTRELFAQTFSYTFDRQNPNFGLSPLYEQQQKQLLFFHATSWLSKTLPKRTWQQLAHLATTAGYDVLLPWGNKKEFSQAQQIAGKNMKCRILPAMDIPALGQLLARSAGAISVDTGLGHLAGAYGLPVLGIFGPTLIEKSGILGPYSKNITLDFSCGKRDCRLHGAATANACMAQWSAAELWYEMEQLL